jgi:uncharacterized cupin superfamily protein
MKAFDVIGSAKGLSGLEFKKLADFNRGSVGVFHSEAGISPWERHPSDDEFLYVLEGSVEIVVLTDGGPTWTRVDAGSGFVVPKGLWHRHRVPGPLVELYATPGESEHSHAEDPRTGAE